MMYAVQKTMFKAFVKCYDVIAGQSLYAARAISAVNNIVVL